MKHKSVILNFTSQLFIVFLYSSCEGQSPVLKEEIYQVSVNTSSKLEKYITENKDNNNPSQSKGIVSNGFLVNGKLMPFRGENFFYFDTASYLNSRAFLNEKVRKATISTYKELEAALPQRHFCIMECSNKHGGKIFPHRTHQNGLSIDFMMPLKMNDKAYYGLDSIGQSHYLLEFDENGHYQSDNAISIDFDVVAQHLLILEKEARKNNLKISKVIIKTELKDELFSTTNGKKLKNSGIYFTQQLTPLINSLHDDHYHVDFEEIH